MKHIVFRLGLFLVSSTICFRVAFWVTEELLFDKIFYQKSIIYGYWLPGKHLTYKDFGQRGKHMNWLMNLLKNGEVGSDVLAASVNSSDQFVIVVIGDSYVWGQGVKESDVFVAQLEKKLNRIRPTKIISLGSSGDTVLDNYIKYSIAVRNIRDVDLYIFGVVDNDLLFFQDNNYNQEIADEFFRQCPGVFAYIPIFGQAESAFRYYGDQLAMSFSLEYGNICVLKKIIPHLPKKNALYFNFDDFYVTSMPLASYTSLLESADLTVISPKEYYKMNYTTRSLSDFFVSKNENHPSALAHELFANVLYDSIIRRVDFQR